MNVQENRKKWIADIVAERKDYKECYEVDRW